MHKTFFQLLVICFGKRIANLYRRLECYVSEMHIVGRIYRPMFKFEKYVYILYVYYLYEVEVKQYVRHYRLDYMRDRSDATNQSNTKN